MTAIDVELSCIEHFSIGEIPVATVRVVNTSQVAETASARLNLVEGDLTLIVEPAFGSPIEGTAPYVFDTEPRMVELLPGASLEAGINVHFTSGGFSFVREGSYRLRVEYSPTVFETIASNAVMTQAGGRIDELASLTAQTDVAASIASGQLVSVDAGEPLRAISSLRYEREGFLAAATLAHEGTTDELIDLLTQLDASDIEIAHWVSAVAPPTAYLDDPRLAAVLAKRVARATGVARAILEATTFGGSNPAGQRSDAPP